MEYDPETCITAGELRETGYPIPKHIPECAWVPRGSFGCRSMEVEQDEKDKTLMHFKGAVYFNEPFKWVEGGVCIGERTGG